MGTPALQKIRELGLGQGKDISDPNDSRKCIIYSIGLEVEGCQDTIIDLKSPSALGASKEKSFVIKESATFPTMSQRNSSRAEIR